MASLTTTRQRPDARRAWSAVSSALQKFGILVALVVVSAYFAYRSPHFLTYDNLLNILTQMSILSILAVGTTLLLITGNFDLSIGSVLGLGGAVALGLGSHGAVTSIAVAVAVGLAVGLVNGLIVVKAGINSLIVTLGTMSLVRGIVLIYTDGSSLQGTSPGLERFANGTTLLPNMAWVMIGVALLMGGMLTQSRAGRYFQASGGNPEAAELAGIRADRYKIIAFVVMGGLAAVAGILYGGQVNSIDPTAGTGYELQAIAAVIIGGTSLAGGVGYVWKSLVGAALLTTLNNGFNLLDISSYYQGVIQGGVIILSVAVYTRRARR